MEVRGVVIFFIWVWGDVGLYGDVCGGDGENGIDLGYVFEVEWVGCDEI